MLIYTVILYLVLTHENVLEMGDRCSTQLAKMSIDPKFVELDVRIFVKLVKLTHGMCEHTWTCSELHALFFPIHRRF